MGLSFIVHTVQLIPPPLCRVYEKMMERMKERGASLTGLKRRMSIWAKKKGLKGNQRKQRR